MTNTILMPAIYNGPTAPVGGQADDRARAIFKAMSKHSEQGRKRMVWDKTLAKIATARCRSQAELGWDGHVDSSGRGPNQWVLIYGYPLPAHYDKAVNANNIESLCHGGDGGYQQVWEAWINSPGHRAHVLGLNDFYAAQTQVGVGYYHLEGSRWGHYWAILSVAL